MEDSVIDHAVTLIGYGKDPKSGDKYYLIQNSWGDTWGEAPRICSALLSRARDERKRAREQTLSGS